MELNGRRTALAKEEELYVVDKLIDCAAIFKDFFLLNTKNIGT